MTATDYMLLKEFAKFPKERSTTSLCLQDFHACRRLEKRGLLSQRDRSFKITEAGVSYVRDREALLPKEAM